MIPPSSLVSFLVGRPDRSSIARVERSPSESARSASRRMTRLSIPSSASKKGTWPLPSHPSHPSSIARCASTEDHQAPSRPPLSFRSDLLPQTKLPTLEIVRRMRHASALEMGYQIDPEFGFRFAHILFDRNPSATHFKCGGLAHTFRR